MKVLNPLLPNCTTRLDITFANDLGDEKRIWGSGFWIRKMDNSLALVTNRHNFEPSLKHKNYKEYKLAKLKILLRKHEKESSSSKDAEYFTVTLTDIEGIVHPTADVAIIINPKISSSNHSIKDYQDPISLGFMEIANSTFFSSWCEMFDPLGFIGYPRNWFDLHSNSPIGRMAYISSNPCSYLNDQIKTTDVMLVTGLSFEGSSGSPVFFLPKGLNVKGGVGVKISASYTDAKLIGIMSGHWDDEAKSAPIIDGFLHSGLSYLTKSTSILELLTSNCGLPIKEFLHSIHLAEDCSEKEIH